MDRLKSKITRYQIILSQLVEQLADDRNSVSGAILEYQSITDKIHNHFQLTKVGWHNRKYHFQVLLHLDLREDGQVWIQQNNTELLLDEILIEKVVERSDIILGFRPDWMRELMQVEAA